MNLSKNLRIEVVHQIKELRLQNKTNTEIAIVLDKIGYRTPSDRTLDDKTVSAFCVNNGLRLKRYPYRSGKKTKMFGKSTERAKNFSENFTGKKLVNSAERANLDNDLLEIISSKMTNETKIKCLLALI